MQAVSKMPSFELSPSGSFCLGSKWLLWSLLWVLPIDVLSEDGNRPTAPQDSSLGLNSSELSQDSLEKLSAVVRWIALKSLPAGYEDTRHWGKTKRVLDGLDVRREGLRIKTKRRWKYANHGTWKRYRAELIEPARRLTIRIDEMARKNNELVQIQLFVDASLGIWARLSQWNHGVQLASVSMDATARVQLSLTAEVKIDVNFARIPPDLILRPVVSEARLTLIDFEVQRISDVGGSVARILGKGIRELLEEKIAADQQRMVRKINGQIAKNRDRLRLSLHELAESKWRDLVAPEQITTDAPAKTPPRVPLSSGLVDEESMP